MTGRFIYETKIGSLLISVEEINGSMNVGFELLAMGMPMQADSVERNGNKLSVETSFFFMPGVTAVMEMEFDGKAYLLSGNHAMLGEMSGMAEPFSGKTLGDSMAEELPLKRTGKRVKRTRSEIDAEVEALLSKMTIDEKIGQMSQSVGDYSAFIGGSVQNKLSQDERLRLGMIGAINGMGPLAVMYRQQKIAVEESRLGIPLLFCQDVIHGKHTIFPIPLASACSFNPELVEKSARIAAKEATSMGVMYNMGPMVDIARDPRWGRVSEGAGEDPYLGELMSVAQVRGYQGESLYDEESLMACLKHFIGYGAAEGGRDYNTCEISDVTLRNIYLPPFRAGIEAGAASIMNSFNVINGVPMAVNKDILNHLLRDELGFEGIIISDYGSIEECIEHGVAENISEAALKAVEASMDIEMATSAYQENLAKLVAENKLDEELINKAVRRVLRYKFEKGIMDDPYKHFRPEDEEKAFCPEYLETSRQLARESAVLLKNNALLPLGKDKTIALIGPKGNSKDLLGPWQFSPRLKDTITIKEGLEAAGYSVLCEAGCETLAVIEKGIERAEKAAKDADIIILALGENASMSGEAASRQNITVPKPQMELAMAMKKLGKPMVLVLTNGRPLLLDWFDENCDAILESWFLGSQAGGAIADILSGEYNPSGKLSISFPRHQGQIPLYYNHLNTGRPYHEGDKNNFLSRYLDGSNKPLYPFGYGLSYTSFAVNNFKLSGKEMKKGETITASLQIENTGSFDGTEVVQLYVRDVAASISRPVKELKAFRRIFLDKGKSENVEFEINEKMLGFYNTAGELVCEPGRFEVMAGTSSRDNDLLKLDFVLI